MQIKCPSCGATQELAGDHKCGFCGSAIEQEKAQANYKSSTTGEVGNLMMMAETAVDATNWEEALQYYNKALEKDITNSDAWLGKGIAMVHTSKIGDIKTKEAIAYWKNAIKHAENPDSMGKRVAKEINSVVNAFYPVLENHYIDYKNIENSYKDLVSRFSILESAQDYATQLAEFNIVLCETGYNLCKRVIDLPQKYASSDYGSAIAEGIIGQFSTNEYSRKYAADEAREKMNLANKRLAEINSASLIVEGLKQKYAAIISKVDPNHFAVNEINEQEKAKLLDKDLEKHRSDGGIVLWSLLIGFMIGCAVSVLFSNIVPFNLHFIFHVILFWIPFTILGGYVASKITEKRDIKRKNKSQE